MGFRTSAQRAGFRDNKSVFVFNKREEAIDLIRGQKKITLKELSRIQSGIPTEDAEAIFTKHKQEGSLYSTLVRNPWYGKGSDVFISALQPTRHSLVDLIEDRIRAKSEKRHVGHENTILVIDNRTCTFDEADVIDAMDSFDRLNPISRFREVWLYTGYYSDFGGHNAEWCLAPILVPDSTREAFYDDPQYLAAAAESRHRIDLKF